MMPRLFPRRRGRSLVEGTDKGSMVCLCRCLTLDAFDFTVFLLIMHPIAQTFGVSMTAVTFVFTITLWMRLLGATASGWLGDRLGRKKPLMIAILGYSLCNFAAGFSPTFLFLFTARAILGLFMGAEWPADVPCIARDPDCATLSAHQQLHADLVGLRPTGSIRERWLCESGSELPFREAPYRSPSYRRGLLLPSKRRLGWPCGADPGLVRDRLGAWLRHTHAGRNNRRSNQFLHCHCVGPRNERQRTGRGRSRCLITLCQALPVCYQRLRICD
jgi:hypothetical protein